jgi:serine phosphatase RsbU (regulator of sigma subunit)
MGSPGQGRAPGRAARTSRRAPRPPVSRALATVAAPAGVRARVRLVGTLAWLGSLDALGRSLDLGPPPGEPVLASGPGTPDLVLVDGSLTAEQVRGALGELEAAAGRRPAVLVVAPRRPESRWLLDGGLDVAEGVDDVVIGPEDAVEVAARARAALRTRDFLAELARKNAELQDLSLRYEAIARRMADELLLASDVQRSLLPPPLHHPRLDTAAEFVPVREIGGDYYDLVPLDGGRLGLAIGDVMGKGVPAALMAANLKACLRAQLQGGRVSAERIVARVNRLFCDITTPKTLFASLFFAVFDFERGLVEYSNAGHHPPFVVRAEGAVHDLVDGGTVLGLLPEAFYARGELEIRSGDLVVSYTDGVTDRGENEAETFGVDRLKEAAVRSRNDSARISLYSLLGEVQGFAYGTAQEDDITLVVAKVR